MQTQRVFRCWATLRFLIGLALVGGIGWLADRAVTSTAGQILIDILVVGLVAGLLDIYPRTYAAYVAREEQRPR